MEGLHSAASAAALLLLLLGCAITLGSAMLPMGPTDNVCKLPSESGLCKGYMPSYFYNPKAGDCERFIYGGCGGNDNRFSSKQDCLDRCGKVSGDLCQLPSVTGMCRGYFPKYFHNSTSGACEQFTYGGCGGNGNKFATQKDCQAECPKSVVNPAPVDVCLQDKETGMCRGYIRKYFHNSTSGACELFTYGGCGGNGNNFDTQKDCQSSCAKHLCQLPSETGMCRGYFPKYFHNSTSGACEQFTYGGCGGNGNKFDTQEDCQQVCV